MTAPAASPANPGSSHREVTAAARALHLNTAWTRHWLVVHARGDVHADNAAILRIHLRSALTDSPLIAVDLTGARLADASGIAVLVGVHRRAELHGKMFLVVAPDQQTVRVLRVTGLRSRLLISPGWDDFLAWNGDTTGRPVRSDEPEQTTDLGPNRTWFA